MTYLTDTSKISVRAIYSDPYVSHGLSWGSHRYIRREGTPGNYTYIYPEDLQNAGSKVSSGVQSLVSRAKSTASAAANKGSRAVGLTQRKAAVNAINFVRRGPNGATIGNAQAMVNQYRQTPLGKVEGAYGTAKKAVANAVKPVENTISDVSGLTQRREAEQAINYANQGMDEQSVKKMLNSIAKYENTPLGKVETKVLAPAMQKYNRLLRILGAVKVTRKRGG